MPLRSSHLQRATWAWLWLATLVAGCERTPDPRRHGEPAGPYDLSLVLGPPAPVAGMDTTLRFELRTRRDQLPVQDLQVVHERRLHTFIVAQDFGSFAHLHQEDSAPLSAADLAAGRFSFVYRFPTAGAYLVQSEFTHRDRGWQQRFELDVAGAPEPPRALDKSRTQQVGAYRATLAVAPDPPRAGQETAMALRLERNGSPVTDLQLLLGSEVHVAVWSLDGRRFAHTHSYTAGMAAMMDKMRSHGGSAAAHLAMMLAESTAPARLEFPGPEVPVRQVFPGSGTYVVFMQVAPGGRPMVLRFVLDVAPSGQ